MKSKVYLVVALGAILALTGCGPSTSLPVASSGSTSSSKTSSSTDTSSSASSSSSSSSASSSSSSSSSSQEPEPLKLGTPLLTLNTAKTGLIWEGISNAASYAVKVNDGAYAAATEYAFSDAVATYVVKVKAVGDGKNFLDSDEATWNYETKAVALGDLSSSGLTVSWASAQGAKVQAGFAVDGNISIWADVSGTSYTATESGKVGIVASKGYDEANNINYVGDDVAKYIWAVKDAGANQVIMDATTDYADDVAKKTYLTNGWEDAGAHASISVGKSDVEETEDAAIFQIQQLSNAYKFTKDVSCPDAFYGISIMARGDNKSTFVLQLENDQGYASYSIGVLNNNWHAITIPLADSGWKLNGTAVNLAQYAASQGFNNAAAVVHTFSKASLVFKTVADGGYAYTSLSVKNITFVAGEAGTTLSDDQTISIAGTYTGANSSGTIFKVVRDDLATNLVTFSSANLASNLAGQATVSVSGNVATFKSSPDDGATLTFSATVSDKGRALAFKEATGSWAPYLQQVNFNRVTVIDTFEGYTETGKGLDTGASGVTDPTQVTGLRASYYGEYYTGSGSGNSVLGDKNWQMMGSTDYLNLITTEGHSGTKCAAFKRSTNSMRFTTAAMAGKTALPLPHADKLSFWAKGTTADVALKVQLFDSNNALYWLSLINLTVPANSGWTQYTIDLSATKDYYGFGFLFSGASPVVYPEIDDIELYTGANPWATYVDPSPITTGTVMKGATSALPSVIATFGHDSTVAVVATDAGGTPHNLAGTYSIDASHNITIDCGSDLNYVGVVSSDKTAIKYASATGTLAAYVADLFLETQIAGKTRLAGYENTTSAALQSLFIAEETDAFTSVADKSGYLEVSTDQMDSGFASLQLKADVTAANYNGKYRYRFANVASFGNVSNISIRLKSAAAYSISGGLYYVNTSNDATQRTTANLGFTIAAGADWTTFSGTFTAHDVYGFSIYFNSTGTGLASAAGSLYIDSVFVW